MQTLYDQYNQLMELTPMNFFREQHDTINWDVRILGILGQKGVGKSTLLRQYVKRNYQIGDRRALYCSADSVDFSTLSLVELAEQFFINGGELLVVDEIHKYKPGTSDWSKEVKEIYELFPKLKLIVSGSSLLKLKEGDADLSRRAIK